MDPISEGGQTTVWSREGWKVSQTCKDHWGANRRLLETGRIK